MTKYSTKFISLVLCFFMCFCNKTPKDNITPLEKGLLKNQTIQVGGLDRFYHVFVPEKYENAPLVILLHGNGGSHDDMLGLTGVKAPYKLWLDIAQQENIIVLVPNGTLGSSNARGWNDCRNDASTNPTTDDVGFIRALMDKIMNTYKADTKKVFAMGTSNGGHFAQRLAQEIPQKITAFGAVVASRAKNSKCSDSNVPISALFMNGTADPILPYNGGQMSSNRGEVYSTDDTINYWITRNQTATAPETTQITNINTTDNCTITKQLYKNGSNNTEIMLYEVTNGGHTEPSIAQRYSTAFLQIVGNQNADIEMANEVWNFFKNKSK